jgi:tryptophan synthase alpha chain
MPFTDPMADGPAVQASSVRALQSGATMAKVLEMVKKFRRTTKTTPIVLMGYYNPIHAYGTARFARDVAAAGCRRPDRGRSAVEEETKCCACRRGAGRRPDPLCHPHHRRGAAEADRRRRQRLSLLCLGGGRHRHQGGAGRRSARRHGAGAGRDRSAVPVGFGIRSPEQADAIARVADGVVVGSAIVSRWRPILKKRPGQVVAEVLELGKLLPVRPMPRAVVR